MPIEHIATIVGVGITVIVLLAGVMKYHVGQVKDYFDEKIDALSKLDQKREDEIKELRNDMHANYVRQNVFEKLHGDMGLVFEKLNAIYGDVRQLIGEQNAREKHESKS